MRQIVPLREIARDTTLRDAILRPERQRVLGVALRSPLHARSKGVRRLNSHADMATYSDRTRILVVAATARELAPAEGWLTLQCGVGPVEAAATTAAAIALHRPAIILHVGIGGARRLRELSFASLVIGDEARYCDVNPDSKWAPRVVVPSPILLAAARRALPLAAVLPIGTSGRVGGMADHDADVDVEAMEGFGVLRAARLAGIPAIEVRAISNDIEQLDRTRWHFDAAFAAISAATPLLVAALLESLPELSAEGHA